MHELKRLSPAGIQHALEKAEHYRLLNEPAEAESICLDILDVEATHQPALVTLVLALSDQLEERLAAAFATAQSALERLEDPYARAYYRGILYERRAKVHWKRGGTGSDHSVHHWLTDAMGLFEQAMRLRAPGNDDSILRWNTCARILNAHPQFRPAPREERVEFGE
jgi:hypothetical protein